MNHIVSDMPSLAHLLRQYRITIITSQIEFGKVSYIPKLIKQVIDIRDGTLDGDLVELPIVNP